MENRAASYAWHACHGKILYVYVIDSQSHPGRYYIGFTENVACRLQHHNAGAVPSTKAYRPWGCRICLAFTDRQRALDFERYLKTHSGRAFLAKRQSSLAAQRGAKTARRNRVLCNGGAESGGGDGLDFNFNFNGLPMIGRSLLPPGAAPMLAGSDPGVRAVGGRGNAT